jgi:hypothetical protein
MSRGSCTAALFECLNNGVIQSEGEGGGGFGHRHGHKFEVSLLPLHQLVLAVQGEPPPLSVLVFPRGLSRAHTDTPLVFQLVPVLSKLELSLLTAR